MTNLARHFKAYVEGGKPPSGEAWTKEDAAALESLMADCEAQQARIEACNSMESLIKEAGGINRYLIEQFETYGIEGFDFDTYPAASFTELPSSINYDVSLESLEKYKTMIIGGAIAGALLLLAKFIKWLMGRGDNASASSAASEHADVVKETLKTLKEIEDKKQTVGRAGRKAERDLARNNTTRSGNPIPPPPMLIIGDNQGVIRPVEQVVATDDRPTPDAVKNIILKQWADEVDLAIKNAINETLKNKNAQFNLPFLLQILQQDIYKELAEVIGTMNNDLEEVDRELTLLTENFRNPLKDPVENFNRVWRMLRNDVYANIPTEVPGEEDLLDSYATVGKMRGLIEAKHLLQTYQAFKDDALQEDYIPMAVYSTAYKTQGEHANPEIVVSEIFGSIKELQRENIRYTGESLVMPDKFLARVTEWLKVNKAAAEKRPELAKNVQYMYCLGHTQKYTTRMVNLYSQVTRVFETHAAELKKLDSFIDGLVQNYNKFVKVHAVGIFERYGYTEQQEYRRELSDVVKTLSFK